MYYGKSLAKQVWTKGIRVNGVAPGPIWTPLQVSGGATQEKLQKFGGQTPLGRPGQPAASASIHVQLAASDARYSTGQLYGAAGGSAHPSVTTRPTSRLRRLTPRRRSTSRGERPG